MSIKTEFEKAFIEHKTLSDGTTLPGSITGFEEALWAAKWMAERCANELYGQKIADGSDPGETIRQLSKELE